MVKSNIETYQSERYQSATCARAEGVCYRLRLMWLVW
jgi:hypothetical protein